MKTAQIQNLRLKLKIGLILSLFSYFSLLLVIAINNIFQPDGSIKYWIITSIPLLIFLPGILSQTKGQRRFRTYSWLCFVVLIYFIHYADMLSTNPGAIIYWIAITLTVILFNAAMMTSRWMQYFTLKDQPENNESSTEKSSSDTDRPAKDSE